MANLDQIIRQIRMEIGGDLISIQVVGINGGSIAGVADSQSGTSEAPRFAMIGKLAAQVSRKLDFGLVEDHLVTTDGWYLLIHPLGDGTFCLATMVTRAAALAAVRSTVREYVSQVQAAIPPDAYDREKELTFQAVRALMEDEKPVVRETAPQPVQAVSAATAAPAPATEAAVATIEEESSPEEEGEAEEENMPTASDFWSDSYPLSKYFQLRFGRKKKD